VKREKMKERMIFGFLILGLVLLLVAFTLLLLSTQVPR
jgi:hypothetical protein